ncbi:MULTISPECIES: 50S ribosomal protein L32 [Corynebacterium]|uniref:Large ribosomal subunit protein bL32 n=7 Tax=Corynebacterium TaxID=1716 RepID=A0A3G6IZ90_9CORY|nr:MULTISPECIES: 50S ribosomal protein L32 [Corynebacterium]AEG81238.1 50S ribosomal protein L32 [Corynebacterium ulcerans 809]AEG83427.1 50S ribosomal protein L32 [Corynebacterium ulcerans BR-AD22]AIT88696.1 50S ribosomal protein L32 [Corynebacterium ulcerans]AIU32295.1 50S ribosomal protein L32 [Corynebacterium ramonii FRC0011]AIU91340.1 50S ribosomal protein L32 [Corynebacterium ulcerans]
MAVPKRRMSRANTRSRRSQWKADNVALQEVKIDGQTVRIPRRLVKAAQLGLVEVEQF